MPNLLESGYVAAKIYLMKRRQFDSVKLRSYFKNKYTIDVGLYSYGCFDRWRMPGPMVVGRYCSIAKTVRSTLNDHPLRTLTTHPALYSAAFGVVDADAEMGGSLTIEDDVWIGHNVVILSGCRRIGRGAVIGAGSIVTRDVNRYAVVVGNPARKLKDRFEPELVAAIEESRWWELDLPELRRLVETRRGLVFNPTVGLVREWTEQRGVG